ncbi:MAG: hypothetical protein QF449_10825 [Alphaproteobacteria bacterium]|jgi:hypothetical protein|nr:hypothetical protein [Alphaproteobacteria bacterium]MDP6589512.1 hypothetical protein [Alphaproteobacteria bacterium]MDP6818516.1 hypothetical protein [Alphaproteobacteria bacterium]
MENPNVFEVQTLKDGRWMIEQRCRNEEEAVAEARELFDSRHFQSVKVVREAFDQAAKLYRETTVFSLPNGNGDTGERMIDERKKTTSRPKKAVKQKSAKPQKRSLFDFLRE